MGKHGVVDSWFSGVNRYVHTLKVPSHLRSSLPFMTGLFGHIRQLFANHYQLLSYDALALKNITEKSAHTNCCLRKKKQEVKKGKAQKAMLT